MVPSILLSKDKKSMLVIGGSGGELIISATALVSEGGGAQCHSPSSGLGDNLSFVVRNNSLALELIIVSLRL